MAERNIELIEDYRFNSKYEGKNFAYITSIQ